MTPGIRRWASKVRWRHICMAAWLGIAINKGILTTYQPFVLMSCNNCVDKGNANDSSSLYTQNIRHNKP
jgi:hypothetical protein